MTMLSEKTLQSYHRMTVIYKDYVDSSEDVYVCSITLFKMVRKQ